MLHGSTKIIFIVNFNKTVYTHFHTFQKQLERIIFHVNDKALPTDSTIFLHIDEHFKYHYSLIICKLTSLCYVIRNLKISGVPVTPSCKHLFCTRNVYIYIFANRDKFDEINKCHIKVTQQSQSLYIPYIHQLLVTKYHGIKNI